LNLGKSFKESVSGKGLYFKNSLKKLLIPALFMKQRLTYYRVTVKSIAVK